MTLITSRQNARVKNAARLRDRRHREREQRILIDGGRELLRAVDAGVRLAEVFVCEPLCESEEARRVLATLAQSDAEVLEVTEPVFAKLAFGQRAEGVLGVAEMPRFSLDDIELPENPIVAYRHFLDAGQASCIASSTCASTIHRLVIGLHSLRASSPPALSAARQTHPCRRAAG